MLKQFINRLLDTPELAADERYGTSPREYGMQPLLRDLWTAIAPYRGRFFIASLCRVTSDIAWLYPAYGFALAVTFLTQYQRGQSIAPLMSIFVLWGIATIWRVLGLFLAKRMGYEIGERMGLNMQLKALHHLFQLDIAWHEKENAGNKIKRIQRGGEGISRIMRMWFMNIIEIVINFIGVVFIIATIDRSMALLLIIFIVTFYALSFVLNRRATAAEYHVNQKDEELNGLTFEAINNMRTVKALGMASSLLGRLDVGGEKLIGVVRHSIRRYQVRNFFLSTWGFGFHLVAIIIMSLAIMNGRYDIGFIMLFEGYFFKIWQSVDELSEISHDFTVARYGIARMHNILREPIVIDQEEGKQPFPRVWQQITFDKVSFHYNDDGKNVLRDVSFTVRRGEKIGIVGLSGGGKSTLFKLLLKEHEHYTGDIRIDDVPLRTISKRDYFKHAAVVLQDTEVFNFSLRENITLTNEQQLNNRALLERALTVAHVKDFSKRLPQGLDTIIGEKGVKLSGGEKQRVGIARAVFKKPEILLLDEATSHLDVESEEKIKDSLNRFFRSVTAIVIAHRLTTIQQMDRIIVLEKGRIVESGSFAELSAKRGRFFELWGKQNLNQHGAASTL